MLDHATLAALAKDYGASFFVLEPARFRANFRALHRSFAAHYPEVRIGYSYKTNYTPHLCRIAYEEGGFAEVVSEMEYDLAKRLETPGERIIFNGPYKALRAFEDSALTGAMLNLDSLRDIEMLQAVANRAGDRRIRAVLRCNLAISSHASRFGFDPDGPDFVHALKVIENCPQVSLTGLHCHFPDRDLDSFGRRARGMIALMRRVFPDKLPEVLNIGGGYFSNMPESLRKTRAESPATFEDYGSLVGKILTNAMTGAGRLPTLFLEPGTAIVADTQTFHTRIISTKVIRGKGFATVAGSIFDISPNARSKNLPVTVTLDPAFGELDRGRDRIIKPQAIVGYTCIEGDILTEALDAPLVPGDFVSYGNVGSYSVVMRPPFILPANPVLMLEEDGSGLTLIKQRQSTDDVFANFVF